MAEVYKYAAVTIVPTSAKTCHDGFLHHRDGLRKARIPYIRPDNGEYEGNIQLHLTENAYSAHYDYEVNESLWNRRGWTLQERMLSRRLLHICSERTYFECKDLRSTRTEGDEPWNSGSGSSGWNPNEWDPEESAEEDDDSDQSESGDESTDQVDFTNTLSAVRSEDGELADDDDFNDDSSDVTSSTIATLPAFYVEEDISWWKDIPRKMFEQWNLMVFYFCQRSLTFPEDKLPALEGLARDLSANCNVGRYLAGLWEHDLAFGLLWAQDKRPYTAEGLVPLWTWPQKDMSSFHKTRVIIEKTLDHGSVRIPTKYRAPTWSWASLDGEVSWLHYQHMGPGRPYELPKYAETSDGVVKVLDVDLQFQGDSVFGRMTGGRLTLNAVFQKISFSGPQSEEDIMSRSEYGPKWPYNGWNYLVHSDSGVFAYGQFDFQTSPTGVLCALKLINQPPGLGTKEDIRSGLILEESGDTPGTHRRVGLFTFQEAHLDAFENIPMRPITLI